jgi:hypothetical protein
MTAGAAWTSRATKHALSSHTSMKHAEFHISYIWVALATALGAGFAMGAYMALAIGHRLRLAVGAGFCQPGPDPRSSPARGVGWLIHHGCEPLFCASARWRASGSTALVSRYSRAAHGGPLPEKYRTDGSPLAQDARLWPLAPRQFGTPGMVRRAVVCDPAPRHHARSGVREAAR